jgi:hypothetical protein
MKNKNLNLFDGDYANECFEWLLEGDNTKSKKKHKKKKRKKKEIKNLKKEIKLRAADTGIKTISDIAKMYAYNKIFQKGYTVKTIETIDCNDIVGNLQISDKSLGVK